MKATRESKESQVHAPLLLRMLHRSFDVSSNIRLRRSKRCRQTNAAHLSLSTGFCGERPCGTFSCMRWVSTQTLQHLPTRSGCSCILVLEQSPLSHFPVCRGTVFTSYFGRRSSRFQARLERLSAISTKCGHSEYLNSLIPAVQVFRLRKVVSQRHFLEAASTQFDRVQSFARPFTRRTIAPSIHQAAPEYSLTTPPTGGNSPLYERCMTLQEKVPSASIFAHQKILPVATIYAAHFVDQGDEPNRSA